MPALIFANQKTTSSAQLYRVIAKQATAVVKFLHKFIMQLINSTDEMADFYTPLADAVIELEKRRKSPTLQQRVREEVLLPTELEILFERPHLVMFRQVLTPSIEILLFFELAQKYKLNPLIIEYYDDKFVSTGNQFKRGLGKLPIYQFTDAVGDDIFQYKTIVDFNKHVGHEIKSVTTLQSESLIELHHKLFFETVQIKPIIISRDGSSWFKKFKNSHEYYEPFLKLFLRDAILFETFLMTGAERELTTSTVLPAQKKCIESLDYKPLIVKATYENDDFDHAKLNYYPKEVAELLEKKMYS